MALSVEASEQVVSKGIDHWNLKSFAHKLHTGSKVE
jgi:hypothetical protein